MAPAIVRQTVARQSIFLCHSLTARRWNSTARFGATTESQVNNMTDVEKTTGVIRQTEANEFLLYFDRIYPTIGRLSGLGPILRRTGLFSFQRAEKIITQQAIPGDLPIEVKAVIPRSRDGGAFALVKVKDIDQCTIQTAETAIWKKLSSNAYRPWYSPFSPVRVFTVKGRPWIEDLRRTPSNRVKVTFDGPDVPQESLYALLRRYGPIADIVPPNPATKDVPRSSMVMFTRFSHAATARHCTTGLTVDREFFLKMSGRTSFADGASTTIHLEYEPTQKHNVIKDWILGHPRLVIPFLVALLATFTVLVFEPIRVWCISRKISHGLTEDGEWRSLERVARNHTSGWLLSILRKIKYVVPRGMLSRHDETDNDELRPWAERLDDIATLKQWVIEDLGTFIVVSGPRGGGKEEVVLKHVLRDRDDVLMLDCDALVRCKSDLSFIKTAARCLGYFPVFAWKNSFAGFMDVAAQGLAGQKTGLAESTEAQFKSMLSTATVALQNRALSHKTDRNMSDDAYLQLHPEERPVVVIDNLMSRSEHFQFAHSALAEWAATLVESNVAHVIFITSDTGYDKVLSNALPNRVFKEKFLGDATADSARQFVLHHLRDKSELNSSNLEEKISNDDCSHMSATELDKSLEPLGGRMTDLQSFTRRLKLGDTPEEALDDMVEQSAVEILQMFLMRESKEWTANQAWLLIKKLANLNPGEELKFGDLVATSEFKSREQQQVLFTLEQQQMVSVRTVGGLILGVRPGRPLYTSAFKSLVNNIALYAFMERNVLTEAIEKEQKNISSVEAELDVLSRISSISSKTKSRISYLENNLQASQSKIEAAEKQIADYQKTLQGTDQKHRWW